MMCDIRLLVLTVLSCGAVKAFQYSDLHVLNASCFKKDSCARDKNSRLTFPLNWKERNCLCDSLCGYYGDCCLDAPTYNESEQRTENWSQDCVVLRNYGGVYMRRVCAAEWDPHDSNVKEFCEAALPQTGYDRQDPLVSMPVTSNATRLTYANYYCALCNFDTEQLRVWQPRVECPTLTDSDLKKALNSVDVLRSLTFSNGSWVLPVNESGIEKYHPCSVDPFIPDDTVSDVRLCKEIISSCPAGYPDDEIKDLCDSYTAIVYHGLNTYRNFHCAKCHGESSDTLSCYSRDFIRFNFKDEFNPAAFSILFDFGDTGGGGQVGYNCNETEVWDPFFRKCRQVKCASTSSSYKNGRCLTSEALTPGLSEPNGTNSLEEKDRFIYVTTSNSSGDSNETHKSLNIIVFPDEIATQPNPSFNPPEDTMKHSLNCNRILLPFGEFEARENGTIFVSKYDRILRKEEYEPYEDGVLVCLSLTENQKFSSAMGWISLAGLGVSLVCLGLHLTAFVLVSELRNLSGRNLASLSFCLMCAYVSFVLSVFGEEGLNECVILGSAMYYFFLSSFCWMNVMAYDVWKSLREATSELRITSGRQWRRSVMYSVYAWASPALALTVVLVIDRVEWEGFPPSYLPRMGERLCWFGQRKALLVFFAAPLMLIMVINVVFFVLSAHMIASTTQSTAKYSSQRKQHSLVKLYMRLALLMGLSWIVGILAGYLQQEALWYIFIFLNTFQGAFIFGAFTCKKKVYNLLCCSRAFRRASTRPIIAASRRNLSARESSESTTSRCSDAHLSPQPNTSSTSIDL